MKKGGTVRHVPVGALLRRVALNIKNAPPRRRLKRRRRENVENRSARERNKRTEFREGRILLEPFRAGNKLRNGLSPLHTGEPFHARGTSCGCRSCPSGQANRSAREKLSKAADGGHGINPKSMEAPPTAAHGSTAPHEGNRRSLWQNHAAPPGNTRTGKNVPPCRSSFNKKDHTAPKPRPRGTSGRGIR